MKEKLNFDTIPEDEIHYYVNPDTGEEDPNIGVIYDYDMIFKLYKQLNCPEDVFDPTNTPLGLVKYVVDISSRSTGKTTNWLLIGMIMWQKYRCTPCYIRQTENMVAKSFLEKLFNVILKFNYIEIITQGEYNNIMYFARQWNFVRYDADGKVEKKSDPFMYCLDLEQAPVYKSTFNAPRGDLLLFDEFISERYTVNEFITFQDLVKTIIRERFSPVVIMLANSTNIYNMYLQEMDIQSEFARIDDGSHFIHTTKKGTKIYGERVGVRSKRRAELNTNFFGFENVRLSAITGGDWVLGSFPHSDQDEEREVIEKGIYVKYAGAIIQIELCFSDKLGMHCIVHKATRIDDKALIVYKIDDIQDKKEQFRFGTDKLSKIVWDLYKKNKFYYSTHEVGNTLENYIFGAKKL